LAKHEAYPWKNEGSGKALLVALSGAEFDKFRAYHDKLANWKVVPDTVDWGEFALCCVREWWADRRARSLDNLVANNKRRTEEFKARMKK
jgi:hypothetical protein